MNMRTLHQAMMGGVMLLVAAVAVGVMLPGDQVATAQHGQHGGGGDEGDMHEHFAAAVEYLELTDVQREALAQPLTDAFMAMQEMHRTLGVVAAELTEEQQTKLYNVVGGMFRPAHGGEQEHDGAHGEHRGERH